MKTDVGLWDFPGLPNDFDEVIAKIVELMLDGKFKYSREYVFITSIILLKAF